MSRGSCETMTFKTEQETFWGGDFGQNYIDRNKSDILLASKIAMWSRILKCAHGVHSIRELGCNIGLNLAAISKLNPKIDLSAVEINESAAKKAASLNVADITVGTILDPIEDKIVDLTFTAGVLIHINPNYLSKVYDNLVNGSERYIMVAEYFNTTPVAIPYRGHDDRLFKRDFAGELIDNYNLKLVDYGFIYRRDNIAMQGDITWFLMEK